MRRSLLLACAATTALALTAPVVAQKPVMLSIASGNTGGVYYPLAGGLAALLTRHIPGWQVTAEVTGGSVDNLRLVGAGRADLAFVMADAAWDAYTGRDKFQGEPLPVRTLMVLYPNRMHVVTVDGTGITSMEQLKGKRVSVGAPGSATELMGSRVLAALGLGDAVRRERLGINESVNAMKDRKIDAFLWAGDAGHPGAFARPRPGSGGDEPRARPAVREEPRSAAHLQRSGQGGLHRHRVEPAGRVRLDG
jgi:TRAP transporter TAXI family solute receptor